MALELGDSRGATVSDRRRFQMRRLTNSGRQAHANWATTTSRILEAAGSSRGFIVRLNWPPFRWRGGVQEGSCRWLLRYSACYNFSGRIGPVLEGERLIDSMQQNVEIDEPEAAATPMLQAAMRVTIGRDHQSEDLTIDMMSEDALLRAMKSLVPDEHTNPSLGLAEVRPSGRSR
jgi:hypothetical protein